MSRRFENIMVSLGRLQIYRNLKNKRCMKNSFLILNKSNDVEVILVVTIHGKYLPGGVRIVSVKRKANDSPSSDPPLLHPLT